MIAKILTMIVNNNDNDNGNSHIKQKVCKSPAFASFFKSSIPITLQLVFKCIGNAGMKIKQNYKIKQNKIKEKKKNSYILLGSHFFQKIDLEHMYQR